MLMIRFRCTLFLIAGATLPLMAQSVAAGDWPTYTHDPGSTRYSPLTQITPGNVAKLKPRGPIASL